MTFSKITPYLSALALAAALGLSQEPTKHAAIGYSDTPVLPGQKWRVHDIDRPRPPMVTPGMNPGDPPSDAVVLFDGKDLSHWTATLKGQEVAPAWKVENGYMEVIPGSGELASKEKFGDCQIHVEWATPSVVQGDSQERGNSGILIMNRYEVQVLDSYGNVTYADGQAGATLRPVATPGERVTAARQVANLRHRLGSAKVRRRQTDKACVCHGFP